MNGMIRSTFDIFEVCDNKLLPSTSSLVCNLIIIANDVTTFLLFQFTKKKKKLKYKLRDR